MKLMDGCDGLVSLHSERQAENKAEGQRTPKIPILRRRDARHFFEGFESINRRRLNTTADAYKRVDGVKTLMNEAATKAHCAFLGGRMNTAFCIRSEKRAVFLRPWGRRE